MKMAEMQALGSILKALFAGKENHHVLARDLAAEVERVLAEEYEYICERLEQT